jgi:hypothetical protein
MLLSTIKDGIFDRLSLDVRMEIQIRSQNRTESESHSCGKAVVENDSRGRSLRKQILLRGHLEFLLECSYEMTHV